MDNLEKILEFAKSLNVLYVEDNEEVRMSTLLIFEEFFDSIQSAPDGQKGLEIYQNSSEAFDIVITDINMPVMNGIEMIKGIKEIDQNQIILVITAYNDQDYFLETIKLGIDGYLLKPIDMDQFIQLLNKAINKITLERENLDYRHNLEDKVQQALEEIRKKDEILYHQSKMAALGEMLENIAHQWRQPLSAILTSISTLRVKKEMGIMEEEDLSSTIDYTTRNINYLSQTIDDFRNFFKSGKEKIDFDLKDIIENMILIIKANLDKAGIHTVNTAQSIEMYGLPTELSQVVINLFNNAKDAMLENNIDNAKRFIFIHTQSISYNDGLGVRIIVKDTAGGIPAHIIERIFEPYFTTKHQSEGTGIGLYMTREIVLKHMHGAIFVENETFEYEGAHYKGAKFTIDLPLKI
jgi:signal transduction histidine kinase